MLFIVPGPMFFTVRTNVIVDPARRSASEGTIFGGVGGGAGGMMVVVYVPVAVIVGSLSLVATKVRESLPGRDAVSVTVKLRFESAGTSPTAHESRPPPRLVHAAPWTPDQLSRPDV